VGTDNDDGVEALQIPEVTKTLGSGWRANFGPIVGVYAVIGLTVAFFFLGTISPLFYLGVWFAPGGYVVTVISYRIIVLLRRGHYSEVPGIPIMSKWLLIPLVINLFLIGAQYVAYAMALGATPLNLVIILVQFSLPISAPFVLAFVVSRSPNADAVRTRLAKILGATALVAVLMAAGKLPFDLILPPFYFVLPPLQSLLSSPLWYFEDLWVTVTSIVFVASLVSLIHGRWTMCPSCLRWWASKTVHKEPTGETYMQTTRRGSAYDGYETTTVHQVWRLHKLCNYCGHRWTVRR
jgi:hypothetical protein